MIQYSLHAMSGHGVTRLQYALMNTGQKVLAKLLIGNELLSEKQCANVFKQVPDPEKALARLVKAGHISDRIGIQIGDLFRSQLTALEEQAAKEKRQAGEEAKQPSADAGMPPGLEEDAPPNEEAKPQAAASDKKPAATAKKPAAKAPDLPPDASGKELMHGLLRTAREMGASDIHITSGLSPIVRVNTRLSELDMPPMSKEEVDAALLSLLNETQRARYQETNDLDFCYDGGEELGRFRTNFLSEQNGSAGVFRLIDATIPTLEELGMPETVEKFTTYAVGIVLVTGPKACGKTTTLASMVDLINRKRSEHIITIEDPIEFVHPCKMAHVNQREVGTHTKTFGNALRAALREAPDVIMVGEMRDLETTSLAVSAAETGHLVLATLHTPDAIRTIGRVLDVFPPKEQGQIRGMLSESLRGVVSQQLVPSKDGSELHLALEILVNNSAIGNMIREDRSHQLRGAMQTGKRLGMVLLDDSLVKLVNAGKIEPQEAIMRASDADYVMKELSLTAKAAS